MVSSNLIYKKLAPASGLRPPGCLMVFVLCCLIFTPSASHAAEKSWNASGDQVDWFDDANWNPAVAPTASDDTMVNLTDGSTSIGQNFGVKSLTIGGKRESTVSVKNFITGTVEPASPSDLAVFNRKDGHLVLKGSAGKITLRGAYKDSEEIIPDEPSFMLYVS
jgi:hypothetical protein